MVARNEVAVPLNQKLPAVETTCVLKVSYLAGQIPRIDVADLVVRLTKWGESLFLAGLSADSRQRGRALRKTVMKT
jgi:hypothetical protein